MQTKQHEDFKKTATNLRLDGLSYSEIADKVPVSQSTLSLWLHHIKLTPAQKERLRQKMVANQYLGAEANRRKRIQRTKEIVSRAKKDIKGITKREIFFIGNILYWAEGSKQKKHNPGQRVTFNNSDPLMIKLYIKWLLEFVKVDHDRIVFEIYSHSNIKEREKEIVKYWSQVTGFPEAKFGKIYYKEDKKKKYRKNQGKNYFGLLRVGVTKSTDLNRKIAGWIEGICEQCGIV